MDFKSINDKIAGIADSILPSWIPGGKFGNGGHGRYYTAKNPLRGEKKPSFTVWVENGNYKDHASGDSGGDYIALYAYINRLSQAESAKTLAEQFGAIEYTTPIKPKSVKPVNGKKQTPASNSLKPPTSHPKLGKYSALWNYHNADGSYLFSVCRFETDSGKVFRPLHFDDCGSQWVWKDPPGALPLYNLPAISSSGNALPLLFCEGEKAADAAQSFFNGYITTTTAHGAQSPAKSDFTPVKGREILIWPDNDEPGQKYAETVAALCVQNGASKVEIIKIPEDWSLPKGFDAADTAECDVTEEDLQYWERILIHPKPALPSAEIPINVYLPKPEFDYLSIPFAPNLERIVKWITDTAPKRQPAFALAASLVCAGVLIGQKRATETDLRSNMYFCAIASSGTGKDYSRKFWSRLFKQNIKTENMMTNKLGTGAGIIGLLENNPSHVFLHDEFGLFLNSIGKDTVGKHFKEVVEILNEMFSCSNDYFDKGITKEGRIRIKEPCMGLYATSTPMEFIQALTNQMLSSGMVARFLFVPGDEEAELRIDAVYEEIPYDIVAHFNSVAEIPSGIKRIPFTAEARDLWNKYRVKCDKKAKQKANEQYASIINRMAEHAAKIALIVSCYEFHTAIDIEAMDWAIKLVNALTEHFIIALQRNMSENLHEKNSKRLLEVVRRLGGAAKKSQIISSSRWLQRKERDDLLTDLVEANLLEMITVMEINVKTMIYRLVADVSDKSDEQNTI